MNAVNGMEILQECPKCKKKVDYDCDLCADCYRRISLDKVFSYLCLSNASQNLQDFFCDFMKQSERLFQANEYLQKRISDQNHEIAFLKIEKEGEKVFKEHSEIEPEKRLCPVCNTKPIPYGNIYCSYACHIIHDELKKGGNVSLPITKQHDSSNPSG